MEDTKIVTSAKIITDEIEYSFNEYFVTKDIIFKAKTESIINCFNLSPKEDNFGTTKLIL